jgi:hypothetical protein
MGKIRNILLLTKLISKRKRVVGILPSNLDIVFNISNLLTSLSPSILVTLTAETYLHTVLVRRVALKEIKNVEPHPALHLPVFHPKKEPLRASSRVSIFMQQNVILPLPLSPRHQRRISALESTLKHQPLFLRLPLQQGRVQCRFGVKRFDTSKSEIVGLQVKPSA